MTARSEGKLRFLLAATTALLLGAATMEIHSAELVLVEDGESLAPIVVFKDAPPMTRQVADELAHYLEKVSGARPEVVEGEPDPAPERAIWVGYQPALEDIFPKINFDFEQPEEILIAANKDHLVIAGRDRWDPEHTEFISRPRHGVTHYGQQEYGTANAVYTFIQDYLDVRWLWQGEDGEDIIPKERIAFAPFEYHYAPQVRLRRYVMWWGGTRPDSRNQLSTEWARRQRMLLDSSNLRQEPHGHAFGDWWERFHETHPEYFALQPNGERGYHPAVGPGRVKMCKSNPAVWEQWLADVERDLEEDPTKTHFRAGPNDGNLAGYCLCEGCLAWDAPDAPERRLVWEGLSQTYVAMSDRQTRFANALARKLRERFPDKDYKVMMLAYGPSLPAPRQVKPDENVIVIHCANWFNDIDERDRRAPDERNAQQFADWAALGANLWWRPNLPGGDGLYYGMPAVPFGRVMENLAHVIEHNGTGVALACYWNFWTTQGPLYYMTAQLTWNPAQDGYEILDDYYRRGFGRAAEPLKAYWSLMEETRNRKMDEALDFWVAYDDAFFARAEQLLDEAEAILADEREVYLRRVAHMRLGLDFTRMMVEAYELKERHRQSDGQDAEAAERLRLILPELRRRIRGDTEFYMGPTHPGFTRWLDPENL